MLNSGGFEKDSRQAFGFKGSDATAHNTMLITQRGQKEGGTPFEAPSPGLNKKSYMNIMKEAPMKAGGLGYQTKTQRSFGLKSPMDHIMQTMDSRIDSKHQRSKTEMYNTILGFIDKNGGNLDDPAHL